MSGLFEPGFFSSSVVDTALVIGGVVAVISAVVGVFTVIRSLSFAGEALGDVGATGGSGAYLIGLNPLVGFVGISIVAAVVVGLAGARRERERDLATGIVLGAGLGLAALFLFLDTTHSNTTGASITILFGSLFVMDSSMIPWIVGLGALALVIVLVSYRMLLLSSLSTDLAAAHGVPVRSISALYLLALALAVALSAVTIGAVLSTALLVGPPATALRMAKRPGRAMVLAAGLGLFSTWLGILLAYDSYYWPPVGHGWPVSFLVVALVFTLYAVGELFFRDRRRVEAGARLRLAEVDEHLGADLGDA